MNAAQIRDAFNGREDATSKRAVKYYEKLIRFYTVTIVLVLWALFVR